MGFRPSGAPADTRGGRKCRGSNEAASSCSPRRHRRGVGAADVLACRRVADLHGLRSAHRKGQGGAGGHSFDIPVSAARFAQQAHPPPALQMMMGFVFHLPSPLSLQKRGEQGVTVGTGLQSPLFSIACALLSVPTPFPCSHSIRGNTGVLMVESTISAQSITV